MCVFYHSKWSVVEGSEILGAPVERRRVANEVVGNTVLKYAIMSLADALNRFCNMFRY
jgi:hypothetical protein